MSETVQSVLKAWDQRETDLLEANNRYLERARQAEAALTEARREVSELREGLEKAHADLEVIYKAAAHCQGKFGGRMSEVDRIFQEITRVASMHHGRALQRGEQPGGGEARKWGDRQQHNGVAAFLVSRCGVSIEAAGELATEILDACISHPLKDGEA